jgi:beta-lactamase family protein
MYLLALLLLPLSASAAYDGTPTPLPAITLTGRMAGTGAGMRPATRTAVAEATIRPLPPITTMLAPSAFDQLKSDLAATAAGSGGRVSVALQELSGPRRNSLSLNGDRQFYAASAYKLPLLMAEAQAIVNRQVSPSDVLCYDPSDQEDGWFTTMPWARASRARNSWSAPAATRTTRRLTSSSATWAVLTH